MPTDTLIRTDWEEVSTRLKDEHPREILRWAVEQFRSFMVDQAKNPTAPRPLPGKKKARTKAARKAKKTVKRKARKT